MFVEMGAKLNQKSDQAHAGVASGEPDKSTSQQQRNAAQFSSAPTQKENDLSVEEFFSLLPNFKVKWPLTRAERVQELDEQLPWYEGMAQEGNPAAKKQVKNITAAKEYHLQFSADEMVPDERVSFQNGERINNSDIHMANGPSWEEGGPVRIRMTGGPPQNPVPLQHPANVTGKSSSTYYLRDAISNLYQV